MYARSKISFKFFVSYLLLAMLFFIYIVCNAYGTSSNFNISSFLNKINNEFETAKIVPKSDQLFKWDFSNEEKHDYHYSKKSIIIESINNNVKGKTTIKSDGIMVIGSKGDNTGTLELNNIETVIKRNRVKP